MSTSDFLKRGAQTPLREFFVAGGAACELRTNSESILEAARETFLWVRNSEPDAEFHLRFWMDSHSSGRAPWPKPFVRGLGHMVFAGFDAGSSVLVNLRSRRAIGRFSTAMAEDQAYWKEVILPMLLSVLSGAVGIAEVHAACVAKNQNGLLLVGPSRSGKSTLSLALGQAGFGFLSDDRTYCSLRAGKLAAWGMPVRLKLRRESAVWFPQLQDREPQETSKGEQVLRCEPSENLRFQRVQSCEPCMAIFLEQKQGAGFQLGLMSRAAAATRFAADLMMEFPEVVEAQAVTINRLADLPCWNLQYDLPPHDVAELVARHFDRMGCLS